MFHQKGMRRHGLLLGELISRLCNSSPGITREYCHKQMYRKKSSFRRLGVLLLLAVVGFGPHSNAYALEGPSGVNEGIKLWLDANPKYVYLDAACLNEVTGTGDVVKCWEDRSGNGAHTKQYFSRNLPTYAAHTINGQPVLQFNKPTRDGLWHNLASLDRWSGTYTLFLVVQQRDPVSSIGSFQSYFSNGNRRANHFQLAHGKNAHASSVWVWTSNSGSSTKFESSSL